jgi:hypothetical protein
MAQFPPQIKLFRFGNWMDPETFVIEVSAGFQRAFIDSSKGLIGDLDYVLKAASNISVEQMTTNQDDGVSQNVTMQRGVVLKAAETLKGRVTLAPFRTFGEIDQVMSEFIFRVDADGHSVTLALFEADGGRWQIAAAEAIKAYLDGKVGNLPVIR